jgi:hypothetical protein
VKQLKCSRELLGECWLALDHLLGDASQRRNAGSDSPARVDQLLVLGNNSTGLHADDAKLDDAMTEPGRGTSGFGVDKRKRRVVKGLDKGKNHSVGKDQTSSFDCAGNEGATQVASTLMICHLIP